MRYTLYYKILSLHQSATRMVFSVNPESLASIILSIYMYFEIQSYHFEPELCQLAYTKLTKKPIQNEPALKRRR